MFEQARKTDLPNIASDLTAQERRASMAPFAVGKDGAGRLQCE